MWYSKILTEILLLVNTYYNGGSKIVLTTLLISILNVIRKILNIWIIREFKIEEKLEYYKSIIEIERLITDINRSEIPIMSSHIDVNDNDVGKTNSSQIINNVGVSKNNSNQNINNKNNSNHNFINKNNSSHIFINKNNSSHIFNNVSLSKNVIINEKNRYQKSINSVILFGILCEDSEINEIAERLKGEIYHDEKDTQDSDEKETNCCHKDDTVDKEISRIKSLIVKRNPKISKNGRNPLYDSLFDNITNGLESSISFYYFNECLRQINIERINLISFIENTLTLLKILHITLWTLFIGISTILLYNNVFLLIIPFFINNLDPFIFIMIRHPYDIGDRIHLCNEKDTENLIVKKIGVISTVFERWNNELVIYSNKTLKEKTIRNIKRSKEQSIKVTVLINRKDEEKIQGIRYDVVGLTSVITVIDQIVDCNFIKVNFIARHEINHQNGYYMWLIQNRFMKRVLEEMKERKVRYFPQRVEIGIEEEYHR